MPGLVYNSSNKLVKIHFHAILHTPEQEYVLGTSAFAWHWLRFHPLQTYEWDDKEGKWQGRLHDFGGHDIVTYEEQTRCRFLPIDNILALDGSTVQDGDLGGVLWAVNINPDVTVAFTTPNMLCFSSLADRAPWWDGVEPSFIPSKVRW